MVQVGSRKIKVSRCGAENNQSRWTVWPKEINVGSRKIKVGPVEGGSIIYISENKCVSFPPTLEVGSSLDEGIRAPMVASALVGDV